MRREAKVRYITYEIGIWLLIPRVVLFLSAQKLLRPMHGEKLK